ncbi:Mn2+dependent serine/threonine protein kinase [Cetobacterium sp.]|uniref:Mn2+dependent serine/threonine protein kinase n=1 Tax=Cetobacterium sp. TaxID=2071632 RepID=UPI002FCA4383
MKPVSKHKRSSVFYNEQTDSFIKTFSPKFKWKLKFFFRLRRYPGDNFYYISNLLNSLNIKTPKIIKHSKYFIETKNLAAMSLKEHLELNPNDTDTIEQFVNLISILMKNNIYSGDLTPRNFIFKNGDIYALDLEDYRHNTRLTFKKKNFLRRLKTKIPDEIFQLVLKKIQN